MSDIAKVSALVQNQFPDFYKEDGANFLAFIEAYYEYLEQNGKMSHEIRNLNSYRDISETTEEFLNYFIQTFLPSVPLDVVADKQLLIKYIKYFNQARGTEAAYKLLFRALYNEDISINYPSEQILKVSDGDWRIDRYLVTAYDNNNYKFIGKTIKGAESDAEALVEDIKRLVIRGRDIHQIFLSNIKGSFNHLEPIRLVTDTSGTGHAPIIEAGISDVSIISPGGEFREGDIVNLLSESQGQFAKVVVNKTVDLGGTLTFNLVNGGSGYTPSTDPGGTVIELVGGDGTTPASFIISDSDITDTFALSVNINRFSSNNVFGELAPIVNYADSTTGIMSTYANTLLSAVQFGFPEAGEEVTNAHYREHANAVINIANTADIEVGDSLFGVTSSANATVTEVVDNTAGDAWFRVDTYRQFSDTESVKIGTINGTTVGTVTEFQANTIGYHVLQISIDPVSYSVGAGEEVVGVTSGAYGVVKKVLNTAVGSGDGGRDLVTMQVTANTTANLSSQFDSGPMRKFLEDEPIRKVGSATEIANVALTTSNSVIENIYTSLSDSLLFEATTFGTIGDISLPVGGAGYSVAPRVRVRENDIASLGIGEVILTLQSDDENWGTGNSSIVKVDTNDRIEQSTTGATGDVKGSAVTNQAINSVQYANGTYEMVVRVFQDFNQRKPANINYANNDTVTLKIYDESYTPGTIDTRTPVDEGTAKIVSIEDRGVLGENAEVNATVGANGTISSIRVLDSGFAYQDNEIVIIEATNRNLAVGGNARISLNGVANAEGYYASSRSHVSSQRGYIHDNEYYQEFSYEVVSPISLNRFRDYALQLVHPAGQALYGEFRLQSNAEVNIIATSSKQTRLTSNGTIALTEGSFDIVGSGTSFLSEFANNDYITVEYAHNEFYKIPLNIVTDDETANLTIAWANSSISSANVYYFNGSM
jgi:hypothetical protein